MLILYENDKYKYKQSANEIEIFVEKKAFLISEVIFNQKKKKKKKKKTEKENNVYIIPHQNYMFGIFLPQSLYIREK